MRRGRILAAAVVPLLVLGALSVYLDRTHHLYDLTATHGLTLTDQTRGVARGVHQRVQVTAFVGRQESGRPEAGALLERYHRLNRRITYKLVDPADAPALAQRLKVDPSVDVLAAALGDRVARATTITEADVTSVLAQVTRNVSATLCMATGHGEADPQSEADDGMAAAGRLLETNGYKVKAIDLLTTNSVPPDCAGLVVASPMAPLADGPTSAITSYLARNGRALVMADPASTVDISPLLEPYRLSFKRGIVSDPNADAHLPDDPATIVVRVYHSTNPTIRRLPPTLYPAADAVVIDDVRDAGGLSALPLVQTGGRGYLETHPDHPGFTAGEDLQGPITIAAAADLSRVESVDKIARSRVVAFGDVDFATNRFIGVGGNARLVVQSVDWVTQNEDLVPLNANIPAFRPLDLTTARTRYAMILSAGVVPGLFLVAGGWVWAFRRRR